MLNWMLRVAITGFIVAMSLGTAHAQIDAEGATAAIRESLEAAFRETTGIGFTSFDCEIGPQVVPRGYFFCDAVDDEADRFRYQITIDGESMGEVVLVTQPASQVPDETRQTLEPPCRAFLAAFDQPSWTELYGVFHPQLREAISLEDAREHLEPIRTALGTIEATELESHSHRVNGWHELSFRLDGAGGEGVFRCGVGANDDGTAALFAYLVTPRPGSKLSATMLEPMAREKLAEQTGQSIESLDIALQQLVEPGDVVEGTARLADGELVLVQIESRGDPNDFDPLDLAFFVLDVDYLVMAHYRSQGHEVSGVTCPSDVVPDGGQVVCRMTLDGTERLAATVARRGGEHRIVAVEPIEE